MKNLEFTDADPTDPHVQTVEYSYNVSVYNRGNVFRYDNQHADRLHDDHSDEHHKHIFDWETGGQLSIIWIGADKWPTLGDVVQEARDWHSDHFDELPNRNGFPPRPSEFGR